MKQILKNYEKILAKKTLPKFQIAKKEGLLNQKIKQAFFILKSCELCERKCKVNRVKGERGSCDVGKEILISSYFDHYGEEP